MDFGRRLIPIALLVTASIASPARAGLVVFTDRAAWETAAPGFVTEDFEASPEGVPAPNAVIDLGLVDFTYTGAARPSTPSINDSGFVNGSRELSGHIFDVASGGGVSEPGPETISFRGPTRAFGADFFDAVGDDVLTVSVAGQTIRFPDYLPAPGDGFFGVVSDVAFSSITFDVVDTTPFVFAQFFTLDDLSFQPSAVPEPSSLALCGVAGLAGLGYARARRRAA